MNGAMALPLTKTINNPNSNNTIMTGASQNFFRSFIKSHRSFKNSILLFIWIPKHKYQSNKERVNFNMGYHINPI
jgi:hypothetical protein